MALTEQITFKLSPELRVLVEEAAEADRRKVGDFIRLVLEQYLGNGSE